MKRRVYLSAIGMLSLSGCQAPQNRTRTSSKKQVVHDPNDVAKPFPLFRRLKSDTYLSSESYILDENRVLQTDYGERYDGAGLQHNPVAIATFSYRLYDEYLSEDRWDNKKRELFLAQGDWFVNNITDRSGYGLWLYDFPQPTFGATAPWSSGMAQGMVLSTLVQAYSLTGDSVYLNTAEQALASLFVNMADGGVRTVIAEDAWVYEEVADENAPSSKILNGFIYALIGVFQYWQYTGSEDAKRAFQNGLNALQILLPKYDSGLISLYDLHFKRNARREGYNVNHVNQLIWLYEQTSEPVYLEYALKFYSYEQYVPYDVRVKGSNAESNGPENLDLKGSYWSHSEFPTWIEIDFETVKTLTEFGFFSYTDESTPKDYVLEFSSNGEKWRDKIRVSDNDNRFRITPLPEIEARYIRLTINSDNGNKNTALAGFNVSTTKQDHRPIALTDDRLALFSTVGGGTEKLEVSDNRPLNMTDGKEETSWVNSDGISTVWVDLKRNIDAPTIRNSISIKASTEDGQLDEILCFDDGGTWDSLSTANGRFRYLKFEVDSGVEITTISITESS